MDNRMKVSGQVLSAAAVALSVIFLALEVRQNTVSARAQTLQELALAARDMQLHLSANPGTAAAYYDIFREGGPRVLDGQPGTPHTREDSVAAYLSIYALLRTLENVYLQTEQGVVGRDVLTRYDFVSRTFGSSAFADYWVTTRGRFDPAFVQEFERANGIRVP